MMEQDDQTGLCVDGNGHVATVITAEAELRFEQIQMFGHWTAGKDETK